MTQPGKSRFVAETTNEGVTIRYDGRDVLHWSRTEWEEDPDVTPSIINVVTQAYERPDKLYDFLERIGILP